MNKQEVYKVIQEKLSITSEDLDKIYADLAKEFEDRGVKATEDLVLNRMYAFLTPSLRSNATKHVGYLLGIEDNFIFNKNNDTVKFDSIKKYKESPQEAIEQGYTDSNGHPLWHSTEGINIADFKMGKPITSYDYSATAYVLVRNEVDGKIIGYDLKTLSLKGDRREKRDEHGKVVWSIFNDLPKIQNREIEFMGIDKEKTSNINDSKYTKLKVLDDKEVDVAKLLVKYAKNNCIELGTINQFYKDNVDKLKSMPVFIRGTVSDIIVSETRDNNIVLFSDIDYDKQFSIFLPKMLNVPSVGTPKVVFGGRIRFNEKKPEQPFSMNSFMFYVPENLRNLKMPESLTKYKHIEEEVKDTTASQKLLEAKKQLDEDW